MEADLLIIGGGINGAGIARDAAGRGLRVALVDKGDLGSATSSASSKLIHGGLRYLEQLEFRLVAEALAEREVLLHAAPHLVRPMRFVMPHAAGLRPGWMIRSGLVLYDWLARRQTLPASSRVDLTAAPYRHALKPDYDWGYAYSDCWVDDARLVVANATAAAERGATVLPRCEFLGADRDGGLWRARMRNAAGALDIRSRAIVNAGGPWAGQVSERVNGVQPRSRLKLVQGSHIVVPKLYEGNHAFILQNDDRRVIFVYPYESAYTLIGTTDVEVRSGPAHCDASDVEIEYLLRAANRYFTQQVSGHDVVWTYCGMRALVDDGSENPSQVSRDYRLELDAGGGAPFLSVYGGKITTYRRLAERALEKLGPWFPDARQPWTADAILPGGEMPLNADAELGRLCIRYPVLENEVLAGILRRHGSRAGAVLGSAQDMDQLGEYFGAGLCAREIDFFLDHEWAENAEDVLWRRSKAGLHLSESERSKVTDYIDGRRNAPVR